MFEVWWCATLTGGTSGDCCCPISILAIFAAWPLLLLRLSELELVPLPLMLLLPLLRLSFSLVLLIMSRLILIFKPPPPGVRGATGRTGCWTLAAAAAAATPLAGAGVTLAGIDLSLSMRPFGILSLRMDLGECSSTAAG